MQKLGERPRVWTVCAASVWASLLQVRFHHTLLSGCKVVREKRMTSWKKGRRNEKLFDFCKQFRFLRELVLKAAERNPAEVFYFFKENYLIFFAYFAQLTASHRLAAKTFSGPQCAGRSGSPLLLSDFDVFRYMISVRSPFAAIAGFACDSQWEFLMPNWTRIGVRRKRTRRSIFGNNRIGVAVHAENSILRIPKPLRVVPPIGLSSYQAIDAHLACYNFFGHISLTQIIEYNLYLVFHKKCVQVLWRFATSLHFPS